MDENNSDVSSDENDQDDQEFVHSALTNLPVEIFLHICSFLDATTLVHNLGLVCKQFYHILKDDSLWKMRINRIWPNGRYPVLPPVEDNKLFWKLSCVAIERQAYLWRNRESMETFALRGGHYGTIDGLLLMDNGKVCVSGGRDRLLICWKLSETENVEDRQNCWSHFSPGCGHTGWIWDITCIGSTIYSCSWDKTVRAWDLSNNGLSFTRTFEMSSHGALLCVTSCKERNIISTGSFCKKVSVFDPRAEDCLIARYEPHNLEVMKIVMNTDYIITASADKTVSIWDQRMRRTMKTVMISQDSYPMSMVMHNDIIYTGDSNSNIHILDAINDSQPMKSYKTDHKKGITGIHAAPGCLITTSLDGTIRLSSPTDPPQSLAVLKCKHGDIASMDYSNEVLAVSGSDEVEIWRPKTGCNYRYS